MKPYTPVKKKQITSGKNKKMGRLDPKEYMKLAVQAMKKSIHERKKANPSPYVGAVLVFPDGRYDTAHRGEQRDGAHAEYVVLDRKNRQEDLRGCWLFATLEPCAPGSRGKGKRSCAERIVEARIAEVWFGIEDKNPRVNHAGIDYLQNNGVRVHQFSPEFHQEIEEVNKDFMKWANMKLLEEPVKAKKSDDGLDKKASGTDLNSLSEIALTKFIKRSKRKVNPKSLKFLKELVEMDLLIYDGKSKKFSPTANAILLFGKAPRNKFPQAGVKAKVQYGDGTTGAATFDDALVLIPDQIENWLKKVLPVSIDTSKFKSKQVSSFPVEVIREAIINAVAHRDYGKEGAKVQLEIYNDRIVVKSPGEPLLPITIEAMSNFTATSYSRNKKLTFILNEMGYMEETALGMDTFRSIGAKYKLPLPVIKYDGLNVVVAFPRTLEAVKKVGTKAMGQLTDEQLEGYEWIKSKGEVSTREYSSHFDIGYKTAQRHLTKMRELKLITDNGEPSTSPNYKYIVI